MVGLGGEACPTWEDLDGLRVKSVEVSSLGFQVRVHGSRVLTSLSPCYLSLRTLV